MDTDGEGRMAEDVGLFARGGTDFSALGVCLFPTKSVDNLLDDSPWTA